MKLVKFLLLVCVVVLVSGCNTARGVGADLELLGRKMQGLDNDQMIVEGLPPENVVEVPTTYQSGVTYPSYDNYSADGYSAAQTEYEQGTQVYTTPYEGDTTYTTIPDAVTYPVED